MNLREIGQEAESSRRKNQGMCRKRRRSWMNAALDAQRSFVRRKVQKRFE